MDPVTVPPKKNQFELPYTVSFGTPPQVKQIRIYLESVPPGIHTEMPMTLTVIDDPNRVRK